jgi:hypothetical protein
MTIVFLTPLLMLADYFLTLLGNKYRKRVPYLQSETYELNPEFRHAVDNNEKFNFRHLTYTVIFTFLSFMFYKQGDKNFLEGFTGYIVTTFGLVNARHIGNILVFRFSIKNPQEVKGVVQSSHLYNLKNSLFQTIGLATVFLLFLVLKPIPFLVGAFCSQVISIIHQLFWIDKHNNPKTGLNESWVTDKSTIQMNDTTEAKL